MFHNTNLYNFLFKEVKTGKALELEFQDQTINVLSDFTALLCYIIEQETPKSRGVPMSLQKRKF